MSCTWTPAVVSSPIPLPVPWPYPSLPPIQLHTLNVLRNPLLYSKENESEAVEGKLILGLDTQLSMRLAPTKRPLTQILSRKKKKKRAQIGFPTSSTLTLERFTRFTRSFSSRPAPVWHLSTTSPKPITTPSSPYILFLWVYFFFSRKG